MVEKITLDNGVRMVFEHIPHVRSVSLGFWFGVGSRHENAEVNGASHFMEHMLFKGTQNRTAAQIAEEMDQLGGGLNAFTTKECTCFYGRVLDSNLRQTTDLLADMLFCSQFSERDIEAERSVISEEIDMYEDSPEDLVSEELLERVFPDSTLALPILGTKKSLKNLSRESLLAYKDTHYAPHRLVIALSGNFSAEDLSHIKNTFSGMETRPVLEVSSAAYVPAFTVRKKEIEQNHLCLLLPGLSIASEERYAAQLLLNIFGGGMSSRLFQTVREQHGLCYSVYSFGASYQDLGALGIYTALSHETEDKALALILDILRDLRDNGITASERDRACQQVKSSILMSLESTSSRMNSLGRSELYRGHIPSPEETIARYDSVTLDHIHSLAGRLLDLSKLSFSAVGQVREVEWYRGLLQ